LVADGVVAVPDGVRAAATVDVVGETEDRSR
jgi:hypothetical protein